MTQRYAKRWIDTVEVWGSSPHVPTIFFAISWRESHVCAVGTKRYKRVEDCLRADTRMILNLPSNKGPDPANPNPIAPYSLLLFPAHAASKKPVPLHSLLAEVLQNWNRQTSYRAPSDWVFASPHRQGKKPYYGQALMESYIRPVALKLGIEKRIGWHTFRHTYSTLLHELGTNLKVSQELLRHSSIRVTMDHYTQAVTPTKRAAQSAVVALLFPELAETAMQRQISINRSIVYQGVCKTEAVLKINVLPLKCEEFGCAGRGRKWQLAEP